MKVTSAPLAIALLAGSANALFGKKPPPKPETDLVKGFSWKNPFTTDAISAFEPTCEASGTFPAFEYSLHNLMERQPKGLYSWAKGLKSFFSGREYPGSWAGWDRHLHDRSILLMEYKDIPVEVREWIEDQDRSDGEGKGLFAIFDKPKDEDEQLTATVTFPKADEVDRTQDEQKVAIFAPGALYPVLPLWVAGSSSCKDKLLDLTKYSAEPEDGGVVAWPLNEQADENLKTKFVVKVKTLKAKEAASSGAETEMAKLAPALIQMIVWFTHGRLQLSWSTPAILILNSPIRIATSFAAMGKFTFKWDKPAEEVYVTGTFDGWTKSVKLDKEGSIFQKTVDLTVPDDTNKIQYKFVVDNQWVTSDSAPKEADHEGNDNNVLKATDLTIDDSTAAILNTVTPTSTTAKLAGEQPLEKDSLEREPQATPSDVPGGFPATPADELNKPISINPLPAAAGAVNPIKLEPGEKIPETVAAQGINDNVKLDKESYEKSDALAGVDTQLPPVSSNMIPESSLPISGQDVTINSVGTGATTTELAGQVPLESKVPDVVKESQQKAGVDPEASAVPEEVKEKAQVEEELKEKVPVAPSTAEGTAGVGTEKSEGSGSLATTIAATAAATGAAALGAAVAAKDAVVDKATPVVNQASTNVTDTASKNLPDSVKQQLPTSVQDALATHTKEETREEISPAVPAEVKESIIEANKSPEAAANTEAVQDKKTVESELLKEIKPVAASSEEPKVPEPKTEERTPVAVAALVPSEVKESIDAAGQSPEAAANASAVEDKKAVETELLKEVKPVPAADEAKVNQTKVEDAKPADAALQVPGAVKSSFVEAGKGPEAAANAEAVEEKKAVEAELLKEVKPVPALAETKPAETESKDAKPVEATPTEPKVEETKPETTETPANGANGTNGTSSKAAEPAASSSKPADTASTTTDKKKKNRLSSFFSKIKHKLSDH
ncbi:Cruciform DNA-recognizing protein 1 [Paramyrothecium foliicola]|nr:Cruciform DNA-recognizing protein 1 [Paramyrothecium foliicola]